MLICVLSVQAIGVPSEQEVRMGSKLRVVLIIVGVLVVLILIAPFLIPVNQFRPTIEEKASAALGRKVQLGDQALVHPCITSRAVRDRGGTAEHAVARARWRRGSADGRTRAA